MTGFRRSLAAATALLVCVLAYAAEAAGSQIWFTPIDPFNLHDRDPSAAPDLMDLFRPGASWANAAAHVQVIKTGTRFLATAPDPILSEALQWLQAHHIEFALETGLVPWSATCGRGIEGFNAPAGAVGLAKKVQRLGGTVSDLAMDEPLFFAHRYGGPNSCRDPIEEVAQHVAVEAAALKKIFPAMRIGDIEPVAMVASQDWVEDIMRWVAAYRAATGEPLAFLHADVNWHGPWREQLRTLKARLHADGIPLGIIFIGDPFDTAGVEATRHAEERMVEVEADPSVAPDQVIIQSWMRHPEYNLPETQPGTMTSLVDRYLATPTILTARREGNRIIGQLDDRAGHPVAVAQVDITAVDNGRGQINSMRTLSGVVPPIAVSAVMGVRINTECDCSGPANVGIGTLRYTERGSGRTIERTLAPVPGLTAGGRIIVARGQPVLRNSLPFPVTPGDPYTIDVPMRVSYDTEGSGYVTIVFLDAMNKGVKRDELPFEPTKQSLGKVVTGAAGRFSFVANSEVLSSGPGIVIEFSGNERYRLSRTFLP